MIMQRHITAAVCFRMLGSGGRWMNIGWTGSDRLCENTLNCFKVFSQSFPLKPSD